MVPMMRASPGVTFGRYEDSGPTEYAGGQRFSAGLGELRQQLIVSKGSMLFPGNPPGFIPETSLKQPKNLSVTLQTSINKLLTCLKYCKLFHKYKYPKPL